MISLLSRRATHRQIYTRSPGPFATGTMAWELTEWSGWSLGRMPTLLFGSSTLMAAKLKTQETGRAAWQLIWWRAAAKAHCASRQARDSQYASLSPRMGSDSSLRRQWASRKWVGLFP